MRGLCPSCQTQLPPLHPKKAAWCAAWLQVEAAAADLGIVRLEAEEGRDLTRRLGVVLLGDRELVGAHERNDLQPASARHGTQGRNAARDIVEVQVERRREEGARVRDRPDDEKSSEVKSIVVSFCPPKRAR